MVASFSDQLFLNSFHEIASNTQEIESRPHVVLPKVVLSARRFDIRRHDDESSTRSISRSVATEHHRDLGGRFGTGRLLGIWDERHSDAQH